MIKKRILIADDESHIRRILQFNLERAGYEVLAVEDGKAALETALAEHPDLVILDVSMPGMTGLDVCRQLKTSRAVDSPPVFLLTARGQESDEQAGHAAGADRFFTKPFSPKEIVRELQNTLGDA
jgi:two-component system phosphate regulon response regulator PhoB